MRIHNSNMTQQPQFYPSTVASLLLRPSDVRPGSNLKLQATQCYGHEVLRQIWLFKYFLGWPKDDVRDAVRATSNDAARPGFNEVLYCTARMGEMLIVSLTQDRWQRRQRFGGRLQEVQL
jgi:hypothetical protein